MSDAEPMSSVSQRPLAKELNMGMIGLGVGASRILPSVESMEGVNLVAAADLNPEARERFLRSCSDARGYASVEELCNDPDVNTVWVATPNRLHAEHTIMAAEHGKHVIIEKPMALNLEQAEQMVTAARTNGVKLLTAHTRSFGVPARTMGRIINSGKLGELRAINSIAYTDWMLRPRMPEELDVSQGGGVVYRQTPHQVDIVRQLGGGLLRSVRGMTGQWMHNRSAPGYYAAYLEFVDGTPATIVHNGYGYFVGAELVPWGESTQTYTLDERTAIRKQIFEGAREDGADKQERTSDVLEAGAKEARPWTPEDPGLFVVSCERGDIRQSKWGLYIYDDTGCHEIEANDPDEFGPHGELGEMYNSVVLGRPLYHDGAWGMATLEVALAIMESAEQHREIELRHQVPMDKNYDEDLDSSISYLNGGRAKV
jgi:phthalate 4,5-cis-dihydrodiol dehydrogenase